MEEITKGAFLVTEVIDALEVDSHGVQEIRNDGTLGCFPPAYQCPLDTGNYNISVAVDSVAHANLVLAIVGDAKATEEGTVDVETAGVDFSDKRERFSISVDGGGASLVVIDTTSADLAAVKATLNAALAAAGVLGILVGDDGANHIKFTRTLAGYDERFQCSVGTPDALATLGIDTALHRGTDATSGKSEISCTAGFVGATNPGLALKTYLMDIKLDGTQYNDVAIPIVSFNETLTIATESSGGDKTVTLNTTCDNPAGIAAALGTAMTAAGLTGVSAVVGSSKYILLIRDVAGSANWVKITASDVATRLGLFPSTYVGTKGYQEFGLTGKVAGDDTGLLDATSYYIKVAPDGGAAVEYLIDTTAAAGPGVTFTELLGFLNTALTGIATFSLNSGDLRCTSDNTSATSAIVITAGTTGTDLLATLTGFTAMEAAEAAGYTACVGSVDMTTGHNWLTPTYNYTKICELIATALGTLAAPKVPTCAIVDGKITVTSDTTGVASAVLMDEATTAADDLVAAILALPTAGTIYQVAEGFGVDATNAEEIGTVDMSGGYEWDNGNASFSINDESGGVTTITLDANCAGGAHHVRDHVNAKLLAAGLTGMEAIDGGGNMVDIRHITHGATSFVLAEVLAGLATFGWAAATYTGTDADTWAQVCTKITNAIVGAGGAATCAVVASKIRITSTGTGPTSIIRITAGAPTDFLTSLDAVGTVYDTAVDTAVDGLDGGFAMQITDTAPEDYELAIIPQCISGAGVERVGFQYAYSKLTGMLTISDETGKNLAVGDTISVLGAFYSNI